MMENLSRNGTDERSLAQLMGYQDKTMSNLQKALSRIGLGGSISVNKTTQFIDSVKPTHPESKNAQLDVFNFGTLKKPQHVVALSNLEFYQSGVHNFNKIYKLLDQKENKYYAEHSAKVPFIGGLSFCNFSKHYYSADNNDFFNIFKDDLNKNITETVGIDRELGFARFSFSEMPLSHSPQSQGAPLIPSEPAATQLLSGYSVKKNQDYTGITFTCPSQITGEIFKKVNSNFRTATLENKKYYIPYPNTLNVYNFNKYNVPVKIHPAFDTISGLKEIEGIIMISTGDGVNSKICYISPHGYTTHKRNTLVYNALPFSGRKYNPAQNRYNPAIGYKKVPSGIVLDTLTLGSEFCWSDLKFTGIKSDLVTTNLVTEKKYFISEDSHLHQDTPIEDTLFYKYYSGVYTGSKTFNRGLWNGIIPSGTNFSIELIGFDFYNKYPRGSENQFMVLYTGYGKGDSLDRKIFNSLSLHGELVKSSDEVKDKYQVVDTAVLIDKDGSFSSLVGRAFGFNSDAAFLAAQRANRYNILTKISRILKQYIPEVIFKNKKYKKLQRYRRRLNMSGFYNQYGRVWKEWEL